MSVVNDGSQDTFALLRHDGGLDENEATTLLGGDGQLLHTQEDIIEWNLILIKMLEKEWFQKNCVCREDWAQYIVIIFYSKIFFIRQYTISPVRRKNLGCNRATDPIDFWDWGNETPVSRVILQGSDLWFCQTSFNNFDNTMRNPSLTSNSIAFDEKCHAGGIPFNKRRFTTGLRRKSNSEVWRLQRYVTRQLQFI